MISPSRRDPSHTASTWPHFNPWWAPGCSQFLELWAQYGGSLELLATTADDADDMPGAELREDEKGDFLDFAPSRVANVPEEDEELVDDGEGEDSEVRGSRVRAALSCAANIAVLQRHTRTAMRTAALAAVCCNTWA